MGIKRKITVATTKYVVNDKSSAFEALAGEIGVETYAAPLDFSSSPYKGLRDYEAGFVKEGVGAGGATLYASWMGFSASDVSAKTSAIYSSIPGVKPA
jgi:NaMN:DMB phosphoribosyltransferase